MMSERIFFCLGVELLGAGVFLILFCTYVSVLMSILRTCIVQFLLLCTFGSRYKVILVSCCLLAWSETVKFAAYCWNSGRGKEPN